MLALVLHGVSLDLYRSIRNLANLKVLLFEHVQYQYSVTHSKQLHLGIYRLEIDDNLRHNNRTDILLFDLIFFFFLYLITMFSHGINFDIN